MVYFAYDASVNGDWVSRYALRMAAQRPSGELRLLYVDEGRISKKEAGHNIAYIQKECDRLSVRLTIEVCPAGTGVFSTLDSLIPRGRDVFLVCGARAKETGRGWLGGTVGQRFLTRGGRQVLALRVVQPGLLGVPRHLLVPVPEHISSFRAGLPILKLLAPDLTHIDLLHVERVTSTRLRRLTNAQSAGLRQAGVGLCNEVELEMKEALHPHEVLIDNHVVVSDDVAKEILIHAGKFKSRLVFMGASERSLARRLVSASQLERVLHDAPCDVALYRGVP